VLIVPAIAAMLTATVEEWFQWFIPGRGGVVQDVFLNWVAIVCGLLFSVGLDAPARLARVLSGRSLRHIGGAAAIFTVVFGMFFDAVHVGHVIRDERIGSFVSLYTVDELRAHGRDRARRWEVEPPIDRTRLAREDQYRTEGIQHVQARNRAWERGDIDGAWRENLILETYYEPVLRRGHQWPDEQHADAVRRAAAGTTGGGREYASPAYPYAVHDWPPAAFWAVVISIAAGVLWLTRRLARSRPAGRNAADAAV
jgi:fumarate reductase subunit D